jgi:hypothetical protein
VHIRELREPVVFILSNIIKNKEFIMKKPNNHNKEWKLTEIVDLKNLAKENTPTRVIGLKLERTSAAVQNRASQENISLKPINQSQCNRQKKKEFCLNSYALQSVATW